MTLRARRTRGSGAEAATGCSVGCLTMALIILVNLAILAAVVWVIASVVKGVFG